MQIPAAGCHIKESFLFLLIVKVKELSAGTIAALLINKNNNYYSAVAREREKVTYCDRKRESRQGG